MGQELARLQQSNNTAAQNNGEPKSQLLHAFVQLTATKLVQN